MGKYLDEIDVAVESCGHEWCALVLRHAVPQLAINIKQESRNV